MKRRAGSGQAIPQPFADLMGLVDFAVQFRYQAFEEEWPLERGEAFADITALLEHVEQQIHDAEATG